MSEETSPVNTDITDQDPFEDIGESAEPGIKFHRDTHDSDKGEDSPEATATKFDTSKLDKTEKSKLYSNARKSDTCFIKGQRQKYPHTVVTKGIEVIILDLSKSEDVTRYGELLSEAQNPDGKYQTLTVDEKFCESKSAWVVKMILKRVEYLNPLLGLTQ